MMDLFCLDIYALYWCIIIAVKGRVPGQPKGLSLFFYNTGQYRFLLPIESVKIVMLSLCETNCPLRIVHCGHEARFLGPRLLN